MLLPRYTPKNSLAVAVTPTYPMPSALASRVGLQGRLRHQRNEVSWQASQARQEEVHPCFVARLLRTSTILDSLLVEEAVYARHPLVDKTPAVRSKSFHACGAGRHGPAPTATLNLPSLVFLSIVLSFISDSSYITMHACDEWLTDWQSSAA